AVLTADGEAPAAAAAPPVLPWLVSGHTPQALRAQARRLHEHLCTFPETAPVDVGFSLATTRSHFEHRAVVVGGDRGELVRGLDAVGRGEPAPGVVEGMVSREPGQVA
ncbi:CurL C-terminal domain-containing protein, partial [Allosalinactinospora lopnorensis]|uniref:CurL C-terminal domain-containing protein n=1 Tax=Allosalinactinospora lopnorensis TaxID=1352348 RepID=UPI000623FA4A